MGKIKFGNNVEREKKVKTYGEERAPLYDLPYFMTWKTFFKVREKKKVLGRVEMLETDRKMTEQIWPKSKKMKL